MMASILAFANYTEAIPVRDSMPPRMDWGWCCCRNNQMDYTTLSPLAVEPLPLMKKNYHLTKLEFPALKWTVTEHFKEYLLYQSFILRTDTNPLTYIMVISNLDATGHWWVGALVQFNFKLKYQKGCDNTVADTAYLGHYSTGPGHWWNQSLTESH